MNWRHLIIAVAFSALPVAAPAEIRTWTSATGSQIEADLAELQGEHAVLRSPDGREFKILLSALSEADQAFIRNTTQSAAPEEPPAEERNPRDRRSARRDEGPRTPVREPGEWDRITGPNVFAAPDPVGTDRFSKLSKDNLNRSIFVGLQYGPAKTNVLYCAFEVTDPARPPETMHIYGPGLAPQNQNRTLKGTRRSVGDERVVRFRDIQVQSDFGDIRFSADIEFYCGFGRGDTVLLVANSKLERGRTASVFVVGGYLNDDALYGAGTIKPVPILATPRAAVVARIFGAPVLYGSCAMNRLSVIPKSGMETSLRVNLIDVETERSVESVALAIEEQRLLSGKADRTINHRFQNMERGRRHEVDVSIDLGPFLGPVKDRIRFR